MHKLADLPEKYSSNPRDTLSRRCCLLLAGLLMASPPASLASAPAGNGKPSPQQPTIAVQPKEWRAVGQFLPLPKMTEDDIRELVSDLATHLEITRGFKRTSQAPASVSGNAPGPVDGIVTLQAPNPGMAPLRIGYMLLPRRLPQLWVDGGDGQDLRNDLQAMLAERSETTSKLQLGELESRVLNLSYMDADDALYALRAMGYSVVTDDTKAFQASDADPAAQMAVNAARDEAATNAANAGGNPAGSPGGIPPGFAMQPPELQPPSKFKALKNLPATIAMNQLPLVLRMPNPDARQIGLVGGEASAYLPQRDQFGATMIPNAASNLAQTTASGTTQLLVLFHPDYPARFQRLKRLVEDTIDRPARQVFVEGMVLEISSEGLRELGVQWSRKQGDRSLTLGTLTPVPAGGSAFNIVRDTLKSVDPREALDRINALVQTNKAEVLSRPSVLTLDNRQATIRVGTDIPIATSKDAGTGAAGGRVAFSFSYLPTGILLNVRPRISEDGNEISMLIDATVSATVPNQDLKVLDPATNAVLASAPTISTRRVQTYARIRDNMPLIIGGLVSRDQILGTDKVPGLGEIPVMGKLFGHESTQDNRREVIIVLTPSVVTEEFRATKAQYPKDDDRFDLSETALFREHYRIRAEDLVDSQYIRFNRRFVAYRGLANEVVKRSPDLVRQAPFSAFVGDKVPAEFIFVSGMISRMLERLKTGDPVDINRLIFFEGLRESGFRPQSVGGLMAKLGDGKTAESFFSSNPGKALALSFTLGRASTDPADMFTEPTPEVQLVDCPDRETWKRLLWDLNQPQGTNPRYTILIQDPSDLQRLRIAIALKNTVLNNGNERSIVFNNFLPGRMLHFQEISPTWERTLEGTVARYFFIGEYFYPFFIQQHEMAIQALDAALRKPEMAPLLKGLSLPPPVLDQARPAAAGTGP